MAFAKSPTNQTHRTMNTDTTRTRFPDLFSKPTGHRFQGTWDTIAVSRLIRDNSEPNRSPSFLFLGREEAELLRDHLSQAFGEDSVTTLHDTYYMGLKVVTVDAEHYISTGGSKVVKTHQAPAYRIAS